MKKILIVAMADSVHTARWLEQFEDSDYEFVLFPSSPHRRIHPKIVRLLSEASKMDISIPRGLRNTGLLLAAIDKLMANRVRGIWLRRIVRNFEPNILHAVETQGAGYIASVALTKIVVKPFVILTLWGSDLFWFRNFKRHRALICRCLKLVDRLSMECERDIAIARELGYTGDVFPPFPVTGGYETASIQNNVKKVTSTRKIILVKGHTRFVGRGIKALDAITELVDQLDGYEIVVYSTDPKAKRFARKLAQSSGLLVNAYGRGEIAHHELLKIFENARAYIGISLSDGISVSLQEAIVGGAFPIQTDTSCANEWIIDGKSGFIVEPDDHLGLVIAIQTAIENDELVDTAARINFEVALNRLDRSVVLSISKKFYDLDNENLITNQG